MARDLSAEGMTGIKDRDLGATFEQYRALAAAGAIPVRVFAVLRWTEHGGGATTHAERAATTRPYGPPATTTSSLAG
jgi:hypothetical protein